MIFRISYFLDSSWVEHSFTQELYAIKEILTCLTSLGVHSVTLDRLYPSGQITTFSFCDADFDIWLLENMVTDMEMQCEIYG